MDLNPMRTTNTLLGLRGLTYAFALTCLFALGACSQEDASSSPSTPAVAERLGDIAFPLQGDLTLTLEPQQARALDAEVDLQTNASRRHGITLPDVVDVVTIIRSSGADPVTYHTTLQAVKDPATGKYKVEKERVKLLTGSSLAPGKKWYVMYIAGGSYDATAKKLTIDASAEETVSGATVKTAGKRSGLDFPMATAWAELPTDAKGQPKWPKDWTSADRAKQQMTFYPLGVLCRATMRFDQSYQGIVYHRQLNTGLAIPTDVPTTLRVKRLKVVSTALSFKGDFDLSASALPAVTAKGKPQLSWTTTQQPEASKEYAYLDASTNEYAKTFVAGTGADDAVLSVSGTRSTNAIFEDTRLPGVNDQKALPEGVEGFIFWAMPASTSTTNLHTSLIAETGTSSHRKVLPPSHTYIYGKKHNRVATSGSAIYLDGVYFNPYTPLDYIAPYNMARKSPEQWTVGGTIPKGLSNEWATDQGRNAYTAVLPGEVGYTLNMPKREGREYHAPVGPELETVMPYGHYTPGAGQVDSYDQIRVTLDLQATRHADKQWVQGRFRDIPQNQTRYSSRKRVNEPMYALAMEGYQGRNKHRVAYRYTLVANTAAITDQPGLQIPFQGTTFTAGLSNFLASTTTRVMMKIEAIHLGDRFVGHVDDIARESFWRQPYVRVEERYIPLAYDAFTVSGANASENYDTSGLTFYKVTDDHSVFAGFSMKTLSWKRYTQADFGVSGNRVRQKLRVAIRPMTTEERP